MLVSRYDQCWLTMVTLTSAKPRDQNCNSMAFSAGACAQQGVPVVSHAKLGGLAARVSLVEALELWRRFSLRTSECRKAMALCGRFTVVS